LASFQATVLNFSEEDELHGLIIEILRYHRLGRIRDVALTQAFEILDLVCLTENVFS